MTTASAVRRVRRAVNGGLCVKHGHSGQAAPPSRRNHGPPTMPSALSDAGEGPYRIWPPKQEAAFVSVPNGTQAEKKEGRRERS